MEYREIISLSLEIENKKKELERLEEEARNKALLFIREYLESKEDNKLLIGCFMTLFIEDNEVWCNVGGLSEKLSSSAAYSICLNDPLFKFNVL